MSNTDSYVLKATKVKRLPFFVKLMLIMDSRIHGRRFKEQPIGTGFIICILPEYPGLIVRKPDEPFKLYQLVWPDVYRFEITEIDE